MPNVLIFGVVKSLHDLFTVLWIGGIWLTLIIFLPALQKTLGGQAALKQVARAHQDRLRIAAVISIIGLWITGLLLGRQSPGYSGLFQFSTPYSALISVKHLLTLIMILLAVVRGFIFYPTRMAGSGSRDKFGLVLLAVNGLLGLAVLFLSGISAALG